VIPLQLARAGTSLVGAQALEGLDTLVRGEEARRGDVVVEKPPYDGGGDDGEEADEEEDAVCQICQYLLRTREGKQRAERK
jgi:hypothetical protein